MAVKQLIKKQAPLIGGAAAYGAYKKHANTTDRRKRDKKYTEKYSGK